jgi:RNA polymerase sigma factor (sigma-70 family)
MDETQRQLVLDNQQLVFGVIHKCYPTLVGDEDIVAVGTIGLCNAAIKWDSSKSEFSTFAFSCIRNAIRTELKARSKHREVLSLDYEYSNKDGDECLLADVIVGDDDVSYIDLETVYARLTPREKECLDLTREGFKASEIAKKMHLSHETICRCIRNIKQILREETI